MNFNFSDYINDAVRILILLDVFKDRRSIKITNNKIMLYDYYLKFPCTMFCETITKYKLEENFDEYYAFFHWQPDIIRYRQSLNYLMAKGFIDKSMDGNNGIYLITEIGSAALNKINSQYKNRMVDLTREMLTTVENLSDTKIEEQIRMRTNILLRKGVAKNEDQN